ncbi:unnamed protein product, partial [marine sediment metagenome]
SDKKELRQKWRTRVPLIVLGLKFENDPSERSAVNHPEVITPDNEIWLLQQIANRTEGIEADCCDMQSMALARFYDHYIKNPDLLKGTEVDKRMSNVISAPDKEKARLISQLSKELHDYIKSLLNEQKVPLLDDV